MAARNRTARMEDTREECMDLKEIDKEATNVKIKEATENDYLILNLTRTGSNWTKTAAYKAGQADNDECSLCGKREGSDHMWVCEALQKEREEADKELAALDPQHLHPAIRHGIAPAMSAKLKASYWGVSSRTWTRNARIC